MVTHKYINQIFLIVSGPFGLLNYKQDDEVRHAGTPIAKHDGTQFRGVLRPASARHNRS